MASPRPVKAPADPPNSWRWPVRRRRPAAAGLADPPKNRPTVARPRGPHEHHHGHGPRVDADARLLSGALALVVAFMVAEILAGVTAHSLALIADAAHMLTDAGSLALVLVTMRLATRPAGGRYTYGLKRAEILSAQANGLTLVLLGGGIGYEAILRLITPPAVSGGLVLTVALVGIAVNVVATWLVARANRASLNIEGAFRHMLTDLYGFAATAAAGLVVLVTGFHRADAIASLVVVALMLSAGVDLIGRSGRIFLEAAPAGLSPAAIGAAMAARPHVTEVHDLHIWEITSGLPAASAHVLVAQDRDCHAVRADLEALLSREHGITHTTLQVDHGPATLLRVGHADRSGGSTTGGVTTGGVTTGGSTAGAESPGHEPTADRHCVAGLTEARSSGPHCVDPHGPTHRPGSAATD